MFRRMLLALSTAAILVAHSAFAADLATIGTIDGEADDALSVVNIRLDRKPAWTKLAPLQDHGSFLQLVIPGAIVPEPGKFYDGNNPHLPKIAAFQLNASDAAVRFFANLDAAVVKKAMSAELLGNRIIVTVDHAKLAEAQKGGGAATSSTSAFVGPPSPDDLRRRSAPSASEIIASTEVRHDIPEPAPKLQGAGNAMAGGGINLREKLVQVTAFCGLMLLALLGTWLLKPYLRRRATARAPDGEAPVDLRTIATLPLAPRQKISLIQIGDQKILLGLTPDSVTFLTTVSTGQPSPTPATSVFTPRALATAGEMPFAAALQESEISDAELKAAPVLKKLPGNDEASLREPARTPVARPSRPMRKTETPAEPQASAKPTKPTSAPSRRINLQVDDEGVKTVFSSAVRPSTETTSDSNGSQKAIEDVTRLIREKLRTLRPI